MKLFTTILAGALTVGVGALGGCSDDDPAGGTAGKSGSGGSGATGGTGGSSGTSGSGGSSGSDAGKCVNTDPAAISTCKTTGTMQGTCSSFVTCACDKCACELALCEANAGCKAIRTCATRTGCCSSDQGESCVGTACTTACSAEIGAAGDGLQLILNVSSCAYATNKCSACPSEGGTGTSDAGGDASRDSASGG